MRICLGFIPERRRLSRTLLYAYLTQWHLFALQNGCIRIPSHQKIWLCPFLYYFLWLCFTFKLPLLSTPTIKVSFWWGFLLVHMQFPSLSFSELFTLNSTLWGPRVRALPNFLCCPSDSELVPANPVCSGLMSVAIAHAWPLSRWDNSSWWILQNNDLLQAKKKRLTVREM